MLIITPNAVNDIQYKLFKATIMLLSQEQTPLLVSVPSYLKSCKGSRKRGVHAQGIHRCAVNMIYHKPLSAKRR